jgi:hypothetical protein
MARLSVIARCIARLHEAERETSERFVDLCLVLRVKETGEELIRVGGQWDRREKRYVGPATRARVITIHRGQEKAARWLCDWLRRRASGNWSGFRRVYSALFSGGRRGGKSFLAVVALCLFAVMVDGANVWAVSPTQERTAELDGYLRRLLPGHWYQYRGDPKWEFRFLTGSRIVLHSGHKPSSLKQGRCDLALYNEAQLMAEAGYVQLRGAIADTGGLVLLAANPPESEIGRWVETHFERARAQTIDAEAFDFDPRLNPEIDYGALASMAKEVDDLTYRREVLGEFVPIGTIVFHAWSDAVSVRDVPAGFIDITATFTSERLGRSFGYIIGADFQRTPHMAAAVLKVFRDPADPAGTPLLWVVDEVVVANADEDDLVDALEEFGRWRHGQPRDAEGYRGWSKEGDNTDAPVLACVIADASGDWQDADRTRGKNSFDKLRARGWKWIYKPDPNAGRNPEIMERVKATNALLKNHAGDRRMFSVRGNERINRAMRCWEMRNGFPHKRSEFAHACDAVTYPIYRFYGRPKVRTIKKGDYRGVGRRTRREQFLRT